MVNFKKITSLLPFILGGIAGIYLTYLVDAVTLNSIFDRIFIFLYFALCSSALIILVKRYIGLELNIKIIASAAALSLSLLLLFQSSLIPHILRVVAWTDTVARRTVVLYIVFASSVLNLSRCQIVTLVNFSRV